MWIERISILFLCRTNFKKHTIMKRTITVRGKANLSVAPDTTVLNLNVETINTDYDIVRERSIITYNQIKEIITQNGLQEKDVKTLSYDIDTEYNNVKIKDGKWERKFMGYKLRHRIKISFDINADALGQIVKGLVKCDITPEISISYTVRDTTDVKEKLLGEAVKSSRSKATAMANAAGVELGDVLTINYSWQELHIMSEEYGLCESNLNYTGASPAMDFTPDDIDVSDSVTIVWEIK